MRKVAVIYDAKLPYDLKVVRGIARYMHEGGEFITYLEESALRNQQLPDLRTWNGDGIIADFDDPKVSAAVLRAKLPVVGFGGGFGWYPRHSDIPYFFGNQHAIGVMAAEHMLERGFRHFGYCGYVQTPTNLWDVARQRAFAERVKKRGFQCYVYRPIHKTLRQWESFLNSLGTWLVSLPKPVAVMGAHDRRARQVLEACRAFQLRVPEEVAVIGVDNDEMLCELSTPELTSIEQNAKRIGFEAAALLDRMMQGKKIRRKHFVIDPVEVVVRRSTDVFAIEDRLVSSAMTFIRENASAGITVADVVEHTAVSRSGLELHFRESLGATIHNTIRTVQLDRARRMLSDTNFGIKEVAANVGLRSVQQLTTLFRRTFGWPPGEYRKRIIHRH